MSDWWPGSWLRERERLRVRARSQLPSRFLRQLDKDVFEARAVDFDPQQPAASGQQRNEFENTCLFVTELEPDRVVTDRDLLRVEASQIGLDVLGCVVEAECHFVEPIDERLEMMQIAARDGTSLVDDEDVVTQFLGFRQDLRRQHDGPAAGGLIAE